MLADLCLVPSVCTDSLLLLSSQLSSLRVDESSSGFFCKFDVSKCNLIQGMYLNFHRISFQFPSFLKIRCLLSTNSVTYGNIISWKLFHVCLPTMTIASWMQSSVRHPAGSHYSIIKSPNQSIAKTLNR